VIVGVKCVDVFRADLGGGRRFDPRHLNMHCRRLQWFVEASPPNIEVCRSKDHTIILIFIIYRYSGNTVPYRTVKYHTVGDCTVRQ
jgi:hypothetical protein